ncbi:thiamine pyrophosphate-binding protein [Nonomuraea sp. NPDC049750]|uniref:thiamine pyrophosphate-binding protein n=1 Tax=Nonomuraea sp. NPDC049750 TaxID=3154738 RepID=UPI00340522DD
MSGASSGIVPSRLDWQEDVAKLLIEGGVTVAVYVPDSRLDGILAHLAESGLPMRSLPREEECVAYAAGQRVAGQKPVLLMQSSGVGNALNALSTLAVQYRLGLPMILSMRGTLGETNASQITIGKATTALLATIGIQSFGMKRRDEAPALVKGLLAMAWGAEETAAITLDAELGGNRAGH